MNKSAITLAALLCLPVAARAQKLVEVPKDGARYKVQINNDSSYISDRRTIELEAGRTNVRFNDVSPRLSPDSVQPFLFGPAFDVLDQRFIPVEGIDQSAILRRHIGQQVTLIRQGEPPLKGKLLSLDGVVLLDTADGVVVNPQGIWMLPRSNDTLPSKSVASLQWLADSPTAGSRDIEVHYKTSGLKWMANYRVSLNESESLLAFRGWITFENKSGVDYRNAEVTFSGLKFGQSIDLPDGETHQYSYLSARDIPVKPEVIFYGSDVKGPAKRIIRLGNSKDTGLGLPLPSGNLQLWGKGQDDAFQLKSSMALSFVSENDRFTIPLGNYEGTFVQRDVIRSRDLNPQTQENTIQFMLVNSTGKPVEIVVNDALPYNAKVTETSIEPLNKTSSTLEWRLTVPPNTNEEPMLLKFVIEVKKNG